MIWDRLGSSVSSIYKTGNYDITEILLKVVLIFHNPICFTKVYGNEISLCVFSIQNTDLFNVTLICTDGLALRIYFTLKLLKWMKRER